MKFILKIYLLISFIVLSGQTIAHDGPDAEHFADEGNNQFLEIDKNGIKVYVYNHKNSSIKAFTGVTHIDASLDSILAVMFDNKSCAEWVHACDESIVLEDVSFTERYHYQSCDIPFPFEDRDFIFHSKMNQDPLTKSVTISIKSAPNYCKDKQTKQCKEVNQSKLVRVSQSIGTYTLESSDKGTKVTWIQHTDPEGNLPVWLVNQLVKDTPYWTLKNLAEKVKEEQYKYAKLVYDSSGMAVALNTSAQVKNSIKQNVGFYSTF